MNHVTTPFKILFSIAVFTISFSACRREELAKNETSVSQQNLLSAVASEKANSPAAHILASEKLVIPAAVDLPANLPAGNTRVVTYYAEGVQKYKAREKAGSSPVAYEWVFVAPQAELYDITNEKVGTHGAGPFWEVSVMDSIFAQQFAPAKTAPSPDAGSIDWLLLMPKAGTTPTGIFSNVNYIQRIATKGGKAPLTPPVSANETVEIKYKAVYRFTKKNS